MPEVPHDVELEASLLGAVLLLPEKFAEVVRVLDASDFYVPAHQAIYAAAVALHEQGHRPDPVTLRDEARAQGVAVNPQVLAGCLEHPAGSWKRALDGVVRLATARRTLGAVEAAALALRDGTDPYAVLADTQRQLTSLDTPLNALPDDFGRWDEFLAGDSEQQSPWVIPGLLRRGWRFVLVAGEGVGKSLLAEQIALCAAAGVHPLHFTPIPPVVSLMVDLENDPERIRDGSRRVNASLDGLRRVEGGAWLWRRPAGIDLRQRRDRGTFEAVLAHCRPQLVCLGPIYKAYVAKASESAELVAGEVQSILDDFRTRYGFALFLEHHAPHKEGGAVREMRPYGSSLWLRWPEFGRGMVPEPKKDGEKGIRRYELKEWRGDRVTASWPKRLDRGESGQFPWVGYWPDGIPREPAGAF